MESSQHWYAVHLGKTSQAPHAGWLRVYKSRDTNGRRTLEQQVSIHGKLDGRALHQEATCRVVLTRRQGRMVPLEVEYQDAARQCGLRFHEGRLEASGCAAGENGDALPDDVMPVYGVVALAQGIHNQEGASLTFTPLVETTGQLGSPGSKLVCQGKTEKTPFPGADPLWCVQWLSPEGTQIQAFYFDDEGELLQANWGGSRCRLVESESAARPPEKSSGKSVRRPKVAG